MTMTNFKRFLSFVWLAALAACGGGGGNGGTSPLGGGTGGGNTGAVAGISVQLSSPTVVNSGLVTVTATITTLDANRNAVPNVAVQVSTTDASAIITLAGSANQGSTTGPGGTLPVVVAIGSNQSNRPITISASVGSVTGSATLQVVDGATSTVPASIEVIAGAQSVGTGGDGVLITAFVKDANNNALAAAPVTFSSNTGTLSSVSLVTNAAGAATATFGSGVERSNRSATITVTSGTKSQPLTLPITGTKLTLSGPTTLIIGNKTNFDVVATDSKGNLVSGIAITATSSLSNGLVAVGTSTTNASGQVRYAYTATSAGTGTANPGTDTVVFSGAGATVSPSPALFISSQDFSFVSPAAVLPALTATVDAGKPTEVRVLLRSDGVPQEGKAVTFTTTSGALTNASISTSDGSKPACDGLGSLLPKGVACVLVTSNSAGPLTMQATTLASNGSATSTTLPLVVVARLPTDITLQIGPTAIPPNTTAASGNIATVLAKISDASGNPVQGATVNFTRVTDNSGGNLLQASAITDASGQASVVYRSGGQSTANNGVVLQASLADFPAVSPQQATLTVNQSALFIALGTGNTITNLDQQTYKKDWVVYVTDANGIPVNGASIAVKAIPTHYRTGRMALIGKVYEYVGSIFQCRNEDANFNGILEASASAKVSAIANGLTAKLTASNSFRTGQLVVLQGFTGNDAVLLNGKTFSILSATTTDFSIGIDTSGKSISASSSSLADRVTEDDNGDGLLWPGNVISVTPGVVQTAAGVATVSLIYAESYVPWVRLQLTASATVSGTESKTAVEFLVVGVNTDFTETGGPPAGLVSPFGEFPKPGAVCTQVQ